MGRTENRSLETHRFCTREATCMATAAGRHRRDGYVSAGWNTQGDPVRRFFDIQHTPFV